MNYSKEDVKEIVDRLFEVAKHTIERDKGHEPIAFAFQPIGTTLILDLSDIMEAAEEEFRRGHTNAGYATKDLMANMIRQFLSEKGSVGIITITEMWVKKFERHEVAGGDQPGMSGILTSARHAPDRQEALGITWEFKMADGTKESGIRDVIFTREGKGEDEKIVFGKDTSYGTTGEGRLTNFLG